MSQPEIESGFEFEFSGFKEQRKGILYCLVIPMTGSQGRLLGPSGISIGRGRKSGIIHSMYVDIISLLSSGIDEGS